MSKPFVTRAPAEDEITALMLLMSVYLDGSGQERDHSGTRPGWRDLERVISEFLGGYTLEKKHVFDVIVNSTESAPKAYGVSLKTKGLGSADNIRGLNESGRVYMELTNSPAKLWAPLKGAGIAESDFGDDSLAKQMGDSILDTVHSWYENYRYPYLDLRNSVHLVISYSDAITEPRLYQLHSFPLGFPDGISWKFSSRKCLRGYDPDYPGEALFDWYGLSGGQLKYYPKACNAIYSSRIFTLLSPRILSITERSKAYWPEQWRNLSL
jgi:hypothetical protein